MTRLNALPGEAPAVVSRSANEPRVAGDYREAANVGARLRYESAFWRALPDLAAQTSPSRWTSRTGHVGGVLTRLPDSAEIRASQGLFIPARVVRERNDDVPLSGARASALTNIEDPAATLKLLGWTRLLVASRLHDCQQSAALPSRRGVADTGLRGGHHTRARVGRQQIGGEFGPGIHEKQ